MNARFSVFAIAAFLYATASHPVSAEEEMRDGVFLHITHAGDDAHRLLMGLNMARIMLEDHPVLVYFDIEGIHAVLKDGKDVTHEPFPPAREQIATLLKGGAILMACPGCLKAAGQSPENLMEGVQVADKARFFGFTKGRILSFDY